MAWGVASAQSPVAPMDIERRELRPEDVAINISHRGICHTDLHFAHEFCAANGIVPDVELIRAEQINDAWEALANGDVAHRYVIDMESVRGTA